MIKAEAGGGEGCPLLTEERQCGTVPCEKDCEVSQWSIFGQCSADCGGGTRARTRSILQQPVAGGTACGVLSEQQACNTEACVAPGVPEPVCVISDWSQWGACSKECGGGQAKRLRTLTEGDLCCLILFCRAEQMRWQAHQLIVERLKRLENATHRDAN